MAIQIAQWGLPKPNIAARFMKNGLDNRIFLNTFTKGLFIQPFFLLLSYGNTKGSAQPIKH
jgi:hypothetical protein